MYGVCESSTLNVPGDYPTIQQAINDAVDGDVVLVAPGTYVENLKIQKKSITVKSSVGPLVTTIDGSNPTNPNIASVVVIISDEHDVVLEGFTLTQGAGTQLAVGRYGGGVVCYFLTFDNVGIEASALAGTRIIRDNIIIGNAADFGAGIACLSNSSTNTHVINNIVTGNLANEEGGGIMCMSESPSIENTTITGNGSKKGGGFYCVGADPLVTHSIIWNNFANEGPELWIGDQASPGKLTIEYSDVKGGYAAAFVDTGCTLDWGVGMIVKNPMFVDSPNGDFRLKQDPPQSGITNPCVDIGHPGAPIIEGSTRTDGVQDSNIIDIGYHYPAASAPQPVETVPSLSVWGMLILVTILGGLIVIRRA